MVINARKHMLKYNLKEFELNQKEQKLILFLSDNEYHKIGEIRKYVGDLTYLQIRLLIKSLNRKAKQMLNITIIKKRTNIHGITGWDLYKITRLVAITY